MEFVEGTGEGMDKGTGKVGKMGLEKRKNVGMSSTGMEEEREGRGESSEVLELSGEGAALRFGVGPFQSVVCETPVLVPSVPQKARPRMAESRNLQSNPNSPKALT